MNAIALARMKAEVISLMDKEFGKRLDLFLILELLKIIDRAIEAQGLSTDN